MRWQDVRVGDLVHLSNNETIPADILLLRSSNVHGVCYIDTCDLDGESNLKLREVVRGFVDKQEDFSPSKFVSRVEVDLPTTKIYRFHGALIHPSGERVPVSTENLLLRESRLKVSATRASLGRNLIIFLFILRIPISWRVSWCTRATSPSRC